jgi:rhodanese-related sulfurtransferase
MKNTTLFVLVLLGLFATAASVQGQLGMGPQAGIHEPGTGLVEPELKEEAQGTGQGLTEVEEMADVDYMVKADAFLMGLINNSLLLMEMQELIDAVDAGDESIVIVDVRPASLYDAGHIPDSINAPFPELVPNMDMVPTDKKIAVVCTFDTNSAFSVSVMRIFGDRDAWVVVGGVPGWVDAGGELVATEM